MSRSVRGPVAAARQGVPVEAKQKGKQKEKWGLYVLIPSDLRWRLKAAAALAQKSTKDYIVELLDRQLPPLTDTPAREKKIKQFPGSLPQSSPQAGAGA